jgi:hypothetical protein
MRHTIIIFSLLLFLSSGRGIFCGDTAVTACAQSLICRTLFCNYSSTSKLSHFSQLFIPSCSIISNSEFRVVSGVQSILNLTWKPNSLMFFENLDTTSVVWALLPFQIGFDCDLCLEPRSATVSITSDVLQVRLTAFTVGRFQLAAGRASSGGLIGSYFENDKFLGEPKFSRIDAGVDFHEANFGIRSDAISIRWCGCFKAYDNLESPDYFEIYTFSIRLPNDEDSAMLVVNNEILLDFQGPAATSTFVTIKLGTGILYNIVVTYTSVWSDSSSISLMWSSATKPLQPVPQDRLFSVQPFLEEVYTVHVSAGPSSAFSPINLSMLTVATVGHHFTFSVSLRDNIGNSIDGDYAEFQALAILRNESIGFRDVVTSLQYLRNSFGLQGQMLLTKSGMFQFVIGLASVGSLYTTFYNDFGPELSNIRTKSFGNWHLSDGSYVVDSKVSNSNSPLNCTAVSIGYIKGIYPGLSIMFISALITNDDRIKLWLDNTVIIEQWTSLGSSSPSGTFQFQGMEYYSFKLEYRKSLLSLGSSLSGPYLSWAAADKVQPSLIPSSVLSAFPHEPVLVHVFPDLPSLSKTYMLGQTISTVGILSTFSIILQDRFGNSAGKSPGHCQIQKTLNISAVFHQTHMVIRITLRFLDFLGDGSLVGDFVATLSGRGLLSAVMNSIHLRGSPHSVWIMPGIASCAASTAKGDGLTVATAGVMATFMVSQRDKYGNKAVPTLQDFHVQLHASNVSSHTLFDSLQSLVQDTTLMFKYKITHAIQYLIFLAQGECDIQGSPFTLHVVMGKTCSANSFTVGTGLSIATAGLPTFFQIQALDEFGNLQESSPGHDELFIYRFVQQNSVIAEGTSDICSDPTLYKPVQSCNSSFITYSLSRTGSYGLYIYLARSGLTATFYSNESMSSSGALACADLGIVWNLSLPIHSILPKLLIGDSPFYFIRLRGFLRLEASGPSLLNLFANFSGPNGRLRLWIENSLILEQWASLSTQRPNSTYYFPRGGGFYEIQVEYQNMVNESQSNGLQLLWSNANLIRSEIPSILSFYTSHSLSAQPTTKVVSSELCASMSYALGSALSLATAGLFAPISIVARDQFGNRYDSNFSYIIGSDSNDSLLTSRFGGYVVNESGNISFFVRIILNGGLHSTFYSESSFQAPIHSEISLGYPGDGRNQAFDPVLMGYGEYFSVRWSGFLELNSSGLYTFYADNTFAMRLIVDSNVVFDYTPASRNSPNGVLRLKDVKSEPRRLVIELRHATQQPPKNLRLQWKPPWSIKKLYIPASCLWYEERIRDSPFFVAVQAGEPNASTSTIIGSSLTMMTVGMVATFLVQCKDDFGNPVKLARTPCCGIQNCSQIIPGMNWGIVGKLRPLHSNSRLHHLTSSFGGNGQWDILTYGVTRAGSYQLQIMFPCVGGLVGHFTSLKNFQTTLEGKMFDETWNSLARTVKFHLNPSITLNHSACNYIAQDDDIPSVFVFWTGLIHMPCPYCSQINAAKYSFRLDVISPNDRIKLWIENTIVIDQWASLANLSPKGYINIDSMRELWTIDIWYSHFTCSEDVQIILYWNSSVSPSQEYVRVPDSSLFSATSVSGLPVIEVVPTNTAVTYYFASGSGISIATAGVTSNFVFYPLDMYGNKLFGKVLTNDIYRSSWNQTFSIAAVLGSTVDQIGSGYAEYTATASGQYAKDIFALFPAQLQATYYSAENLTIPLISFVERLIDPGFNFSMSYSALGARFEGIANKSRDELGFLGISMGSPGDRVKLWVEGRLLIEQWTSLSKLILENITTPFSSDYASFIVEYKRTSILTKSAFFSTSSSRIFSVVQLEDVQGHGPIQLQVFPASSCATKAYAFGQSISIATAGVQSIFTIQTRDIYSNFCSTYDDNFLVRVGSSFSAEIARPGPDGTLFGFYSTIQDGPILIHVAQGSRGGLTGQYFDSLSFDGDPLLVLNIDDSIVRPPQKVTRKRNYSAMRWTGYVQAVSRVGVGLQATYYNDILFAPSNARKAIGLTGADAIDFSSMQDVYPAGSSLEALTGYGIRWSGFIRPSQFGFYTFHSRLLGLKDKLLLWVDKTLLLNHSSIVQVNSSNITWFRPTDILQNVKALKAGFFYQIQVEYQHTETNGSTQHGLTLGWDFGNGIRRVEPHYLFPIDRTAELVPHQFFLKGGKGSRLWIGGELVIDFLETEENRVQVIPVLLCAGTLYELRLECRQAEGSQDLPMLSWKTDLNQEIGSIPSYLLWSSFSISEPIVNSPYPVFVHPGPICTKRSEFFARSPESPVLVGQQFYIGIRVKDSFGNHLTGAALPQGSFLVVLSHSASEFYSSYLNRYIRTDTTAINVPVSCRQGLCVSSISTTKAGLHSVNGNMISGGGLSATYYTDSSFEVTRNENQAFNSIEDRYSFSRWSGFLKPSIISNYTFFISLDHGYERAKLWIDSILVVDQWNSLTSLAANGSIALEKDLFYEIKLQYQSTVDQNLTLSLSKLHWSHSSALKQNIPQSFLYTSTQIGDSIIVSVLPHFPQVLSNIFVC